MLFNGDRTHANQPVVEIRPRVDKQWPSVSALSQHFHSAQHAVAAGGGGDPSDIDSKSSSSSSSSSSSVHATTIGFDLSYQNIHLFAPQLPLLFPMIRILDLSHNRLVELPAQVISPLKFLEVLDVSWNLLRDLPSNLAQLYRLRVLRCDGNQFVMPLSYFASVHLGTTSVLRYLRSQVPPAHVPELPARHFVTLPGPRSPSEFTVMNYNILSDLYCTPEQYWYADEVSLSWAVRSRALMAEILSYSPDIICLQEVQVLQWQSLILPTLADAGYEGYFQPKSRARTMENHDAVDGCAIVWRTARFQLVSQAHTRYFDFRSIVMGREDLTAHPEAFNRLVNRDNIATAVLLRDVQFTNAPHLLVANCHIHWDEDFQDVKLLQTQLMLEGLERAMQGAPEWRDAALLMCGDFNSLPNSPVHRLVLNGSISVQDAHFPPNVTYGNYSDAGVLKHNFSLKSAYASVSPNGAEPPYTNMTGVFSGTLDYIFYDRSRLTPTAALQPVPPESVEIPLPNARSPSDHISLVAKLQYSSSSFVPSHS